MSSLTEGTNMYEKILNTPIIESDEALMASIHSFVIDTTNPMSQRIRILKRLDEVMGEDMGPVTERDVYYYTEAAAEEDEY